MGKDRHGKREFSDQRTKEYSLSMKHDIAFTLMMRSLADRARRWVEQELFSGLERSNQFTKGQLMLFAREVVYELCQRIIAKIEQNLRDIGCEVEPLFPSNEDQDEKQSE